MGGRSADGDRDIYSAAEASDPTGAEQEYLRRLGRRIRGVRRRRGLSLKMVEFSSSGEFKASALGAYERGQRTISVPRLHRLADLYGTTVDDLLPPEGDDHAGGHEEEVIDLRDFGPGHGDAEAVVALRQVVERLLKR